MGFLDALAGTGRAVSTIPQRQDRIRDRNTKAANQQFAYAYSQAAAADDLDGMETMFKKFGNAVSPEVLTKAAGDLQQRRDTLASQTEEQQIRQLQLQNAQNVANKSELDLATQVSGGAGFAQAAGRQAVEAAEAGGFNGGLEQLLAINKQGEAIDSAKQFEVDKREADLADQRARTAATTAGTETTEFNLQEAKRLKAIREKMNASLSTGNTEEAAQFASMAGMHKTAEMLTASKKLFDKEKVSAETTLRKEYEGLNKDFISQRDAFGRIMATVGSAMEGGRIDGTAAGDLALIFNFMKLLDPGSVVRESEFRTAAESGSLDERINAHVQRVISGQRLDPNVRADFINQAKELYASALQSNKSTTDIYSGISERSGLDVRNIAVDLQNTKRVQAMLENRLDPDDEIKTRYQTEYQKSIDELSSLVQGGGESEPSGVQTVDPHSPGNRPHDGSPPPQPQVGAKKMFDEGPATFVDGKGWVLDSELGA